MIVMPVFSILGNAAVIGWTYDFSRDRLHYKWLISDIGLNLMACIFYLQYLERIEQEQSETNELYESLANQEDTDEPEANKEYRVLDIKQDYYSVTFLTFIQHYRESFTITDESMSIYIVNVVTVFVLQMILVIFTYYFMVNKNEKEGYYLVLMHHDVILTRMIVSFLMHMKSEPEIRQALKMLKYVINHQPAKGKIQKLYRQSLGKEFPVPDDPKLLTKEVLSQAFTRLK